MGNESALLWGFFFGTLGVGYFVYGKRQRTVVTLLCGIALMLFPYFVSSTMLLLSIGTALLIAPFFVKF
jgi:hypothetical protein